MTLTTLNKNQQELLDAVAEAKLQADVDIAHRKLSYEAGVELDKSPIYDAVARATLAGVPARRLGQALNTSDHKTIKSYYPATGG